MSLSESLSNLNYYKNILLNKYNIQKDDSNITQYYTVDITVSDDGWEESASYFYYGSKLEIVAAKKNGKIFDVITGFNIEKHSLEKTLMDEYEYGQLKSMAEHSIFVNNIIPITKEEAASALYFIKSSNCCQKYIQDFRKYQENQQKYINLRIENSVQEQKKKQYVRDNVDSILNSFNKLF